VSANAILLCVACEIALVIGQLLLKRAMSATPVRIGLLAGGIAFEAIWFFLWLYLLARWDLSRIFPFEGLNPVAVALGAAVFLHERLPLRAWIGIATISAGIALVTTS
jgi:drug/metabolite transporter (DMT)-like permease